MTAENPIDKAIAEANAQSASAAPAPGTAIETVKQTQNGVAVHVAASPVSVADIMAGSMNVDGYLKVKEFGLLIDDKTTQLMTSVKVNIDFSRGGLTPFEGIRFGKPPTYKKTFDRATCSTGGSWSDAIRLAQQIEPSAQTYIGADLQMTLTEDAKDNKGALVAPKGFRLGHSTSVTNRLNLADFLKDPQVAAAQKAGQTISAEIGFQARTNKDKQTWGVITFKFLSLVEEAE